MTSPRPTRKRRAGRKRTPAESVTRLDGAGRWAETLDHFVWFLHRAGIKPDEMSAAFAASLTRHANVESLTMPRPEVLEHSRILTRWATDPDFLDEVGKPRVLPRTGIGASFASLVKRALPDAQADEVFSTLQRCGVIQETPEGRIEVLSTLLILQKSKNDAEILGYALQGFLAIMTSARSNLTSTDPKEQWCQFLRLALSERFDLTYLPHYDALSKASAEKELERNDQWFARHEAKGSKGNKGKVGCVGMGIFVFRVDQ